MGSDLDRVLAAQRALLSPALYTGGPPTGEWAADAVAAVGELAMSDHTLFFLPTRFGPRGSGVRVYTHDTDPSVVVAFEGAATGEWDGEATWTDDLLCGCHTTCRQGGAGVYHEQDLAPRSAIEASPFYQEALAPHGLHYSLSIAAPLPDGREFAVAAFYERSDAAGFSDRTHALFTHLVPALSAGVRAFVRHEQRGPARRQTLVSAVDVLDAPVLLASADGDPVHQSDALTDLLHAEAADGRLQARVDQWTQFLTGLNRRTRTGPALPAGAVQGARGRYRVGGVRLEPDLADGIGALVTVERLDEDELPDGAT